MEPGLWAAHLINALKGWLGPLVSERLKNKATLEYKQKETEITAQQIEVFSDAISEASKKHQDLDIQFDRDGLTIKPKAELNSVSDRALARFTYQEIRKQQNIESVIQQACEYVPSDSEFDPLEAEVVSKDWIARFFNSVEDISDSMMQQIWARILAGEIQHPKSYSLRTLEALRNLSVDEAHLFEKFARFTVISSEPILIRDTELWKKYDLSFTEARLLDDCGLLSTNDVSCDFSPSPNPSEPKKLFHNNRIIGLLSNNSGSVHISCFAFTKTGKELFRLLKNETHGEFLCDYIKLLQKKYPEHKFSAHEIVVPESADGTISYKATPIDLDAQ